MEKIKQLDRYQKVILLLMMAMVLVFTILYSITIGREGYAYMDAILVPSEENGTTTYSGKIDGEQAVFTVSADKTVEFRYGDKVYGPYSAKEDATAIPEDGNEGMVGIELYDGREIIFPDTDMENGFQPLPPLISMNLRTRLQMLPDAIPRQRRRK